MGEAHRFYGSVEHLKAIARLRHANPTREDNLRWAEVVVKFELAHLPPEPELVVVGADS